MGSHRFRFSVTAPTFGSSVASWQDDLRRIEAAGFDAVVMADHFTGGWNSEPLVTLTAAAVATSTLRVQTGVLGVDYRHPVLVHRMAATLDALSGGRLTLGLGAGWMTSDYEAAGIPYDPPSVRLQRLEETVAIVKGLFGPQPFSYEGRHYRVDSLEGHPAPTQAPHPPIFLGGGSPRVLRMAGRLGDMVGINASLRQGAMGRHAVVDLFEDRVIEKVGWVREGTVAAGRHPEDVVIEMNHWLVRITPTPAEAVDFLDRMAARFDVDASSLQASPSVLVGTPEQCRDLLQERRERLGISYFQMDAGFSPENLEDLVPVVAGLAGS